MIIDCISDLHGCRPEMPGGDMLIVAGDLTAHDKPDELWNFSQWVMKQDYKHKIVIAGNHDNVFYNQYKTGEKPFVPFIYLCDSSFEIDGLKIYGSSWTHWFKNVNPNCTAFMIPEENLKWRWENIPSNTDILITHSPPYGILDDIDSTPHDKRMGCPHLLKRVLEIKPKLHVFGHIHEGYGRLDVKWNDYRKTVFVNAAHMNVHYMPENEQIRVTL